MAEETHLLIVAGLGGGEPYNDSFHNWSASLHSAAEKRLGIARSRLHYLGEKPERDAGRIDGAATRDSLAKVFGEMAQQAQPEDSIFVILFGHGSGQGDETRFNLKGPDPTARDFATWLGAFPTQRVVFVNAASASGDFQKTLAAKNRIIVTSTKSSQERNEAIFGQYFSEALTGESADSDKNGRVSILEAFEWTKAQVASEYQKTRRLLTEHAVLEDGAQGALARATFLGGTTDEDETQVPPSGAGATTTPALATLTREKRTLESRIEALKVQRAQGSVTASDYAKELEALLLDLALKNEEIRKARTASVPVKK